jgi:CHAT domain-containing protein/tetratricopeptide (TPR) repeat protein
MMTRMALAPSERRQALRAALWDNSQTVLSFGGHRRIFLGAGTLSGHNQHSLLYRGLQRSGAMPVRWLWHAVAVLGLVALLESTCPTSARAQVADNLAALRSKVSQLYDRGNYADAIPIAEQYIALARQRNGEEAAEFAVAIGWLANIYQALGRYSEAEPLYNRSLAILERVLDPDHPDFSLLLNNFALLCFNLGRYSEAERHYKRALAIRERTLGPDHSRVATSLVGLAAVYWSLGRYAEAEPLYKRALSIDEKVYGSENPEVGKDVYILAVLYWNLGRYADAEPLYKRALAILEKVLGPNHSDVGAALAGLALIYWNLGRDAEAEPLYTRALAVKENAVGPDHPDVGAILGGLAAVYGNLGRDAEAEPLWKRALAIKEKAVGADHPDVAAALLGLAAVYRNLGRDTEAEPLLKRSLAIREKVLGPDHTDVAHSLNNLGGFYERQGRKAEAERHYRRALAIFEKALGPDHPYVADSLGNLATLYRVQGHYAEAEPLFKRALAIREKALGPDHPDVGVTLNSLAILYFRQRDWARAADIWRRSSGVIITRAQRGILVGQALTGAHKTEAERLSFRFWVLVKAASRVPSYASRSDTSLTEEMFQIAQWAQSSQAAQSLQQMASRGATRDLRLALLVRERQDLVTEWQQRDHSRAAAVAQAPDKRDRHAEAINAARLADIDARIADIDKRLVVDFPDYAALVSPSPLPVESLRAQLGSDEALVLVLDTPESQPSPEETFIWVITKSDTRWVKSELGTEALTERVTALRCGLDDEEWAGIERPARCVKLLNVAKPEQKEPLPFSLGIAHELYQALFGSVEDLIKDKHLLIVPSGPLTSLPFQVLVTEKPETALPKSYAGYRNVAWLGRRQPLTVLPSVASLRALREFAKGGRASQDYIGYGDPVLVGDGSCRKTTPPETCPSRGIAVAQAPNQVHQPRSRYSRRSPILTEVFSRGAGSEAVLAQVRKLCPLEDTAYEIKCIAQSLPKSKIRIRDEATVADIKALSDSGELATYRVVQFATHGLLAGDVELMTRLQGEPALVLTPPREPRDMDDNGLLTASKVAELKLNADWVVLSACNTAAGNRLGAEALSGLARAFFYAGARALLVSHWPVYSDAAVRLTTKAFAEIEADATVTRAEAMRRAMVALMDDASEEDNAHPSVWAPFVLVGEGAR